MEGICNLIYTSLEDGKQAGYIMMAKSILQSAPLLALYTFFIARWIVKKISRIIHIFQKQ